jgi:hypothetical protein
MIVLTKACSGSAKFDWKFTDGNQKAARVEQQAVVPDKEAFVTSSTSSTTTPAEKPASTVTLEAAVEKPAVVPAEDVFVTVLVSSLSSICTNPIETNHIRITKKCNKPFDPEILKRICQQRALN